MTEDVGYDRIFSDPAYRDGALQDQTADGTAPPIAEEELLPPPQKRKGVTIWLHTVICSHIHLC